MPPPWKRLCRGTCDADETVDTRPTRGALRRYYWDQSVSFVHSADQTAAIGVHNCGVAGGGAVNNSFSVVLSSTPTVLTITMPVMFPFVPLGGIPTTMVLIPPSVPPKIHLREPTVINLTY